MHLVRFIGKLKKSVIIVNFLLTVLTGTFYLLIYKAEIIRPRAM
jgi:hypothetical protein